MKTKTRLRVKAIHADTADEFNAIIDEILNAANAPKITYMEALPFAAYVEYRETQEIPETIAERYELQGEGATCGDCPFLVRTKDKRCKWHYCAQHEQRATEGRPACDVFYEWKEARADV